MVFTDEKLEEYMYKALELAQIAKDKREVPIGAIVVDNNDGTIIGRGYNEREEKQDSLLHAEINAIQEACQAKKSWRLEDTTLFVTLEPCPMCAGAIINSRIPNLVYGAQDPKAGSVDTLNNLLTDTRYNHQSQVQAGILKSECAEILKSFFREIRKKNK